MSEKTDKPSEADLEFFHLWLHDATQGSGDHPEDRSAEGEDARALRVGSWLLGFYDAVHGALD